MKFLIFLAAYANHHIIGGQPGGKYWDREKIFWCFIVDVHLNLCERLSLTPGPLHLDKLKCMTHEK